MFDVEFDGLLVDGEGIQVNAVDANQDARPDGRDILLARAMVGVLLRRVEHG